MHVQLNPRSTAVGDMCALGCRRGSQMPPAVDVYVAAALLRVGGGEGRGMHAQPSASCCPTTSRLPDVS